MAAFTRTAALDRLDQRGIHGRHTGISRQARQLGAAITEVNYQAKCQTGKPLPWKRFPKPLEEMKPDEVALVLELANSCGECVATRVMNDQTYWFRRCTPDIMPEQPAFEELPEDGVDVLPTPVQEVALADKPSEIGQEERNRLLAALEEAYRSGQLQDRQLWGIALVLGNALQMNAPMAEAIRRQFRTTDKEIRARIFTLMTVVPAVQPLAQVI